MRIRSHVPGRLIATAALTLASAGAAAAPSAAVAAPGGSPPVGHVYLDDNTTVANTIAGFTRHADGSLTALPGSPFAAGGAGTGAGIASQGAVAIAHRGRFLLAVDAGSNEISVLRVTRAGGLVPADGGPVASGGINPVSIAVHRHLVYVANAGVGGTNLTGFAVDWRGRLIAAPGSPYAAQGLGPFGSEFGPTAPDELFVSNAHNGTGLGTVSAFHDGFSGRLTPIGSSPFADEQTAPCWVTISPDGRYLFTVNTGSGTISSYRIARDGALTLGTSTPVGNQGGVGAVDAGLTPNGDHLYVNESRIAAVGEFSVRGGALTELPGSPVALPSGAHPAGIAVR